jgi:hypothetical protein
MVRQGALASFILVLGACSQEVDDPANFTAGNTQGNSSGSTAATGGSEGNTTDVADGGNSATSTTSGVDSSGGGGDTSTGPAADTGGVGNCGNGVIDAGEQCDGADLQGFDCQSLGLNGGTLACDPMMCTFDTSMCSSTTGGTSG